MMPDLSFEKAVIERGLTLVCGIDEAGRGPLAGPVSAAAVILPPNYSLNGLDDSKKITAKKREALFEIITSDPQITWAMSYAEPDEIDEKNILRATHAVMERAAKSLEEKYHVKIDHCLIDGLSVKNFPYSSEGIVKGDSKSLSIAAASIIAKVSRDRLMNHYDEEFPEYSFKNHMGYGTKKHLIALENHGPCRIHRRSFQPISQLSYSVETQKWRRMDAE
jgi:ribonuclease HII